MANKYRRIKIMAKQQKNKLRKQPGAVLVPQNINPVPNNSTNNPSQVDTQNSQAQEQVNKPQKPETSTKDSVMKRFVNFIKGWLLGAVEEELINCNDSLAQVRNAVDGLSESSDNLKLCIDNTSKNSALMIHELSLLRQDNVDLNEEIKRKSEDLPRKINEAKKMAKQEGYSAGEDEGFKKGKKEVELRILNVLQNQFKGIISSNVMTPEEGLRLIAIKLNDLKAQLSSSEELKKQLADAKQKEQEAILLAEYIQNSDKGELIKQLHEIEETKNRISGELDKKNEEVVDLQTQITGLNKTISRLQSDIAGREQLIRENDSKYSSERAQLQAAHKKELSEQLASQKEAFDKEKTHMQDTYNANRAKLEKQLQEKDVFHKETIEKLNSDHAAVVAKLNADNEEKISIMEKSHTAAVDAMEKKHSEEIDKMNADLKKEEAAKKEVATTLATESEIVRKLTLELASQLAEIAKEEEPILSCCSDFDEVAQGKSSELKSASQALLKELDALPQAKTPSEWVAKVTAVLTELLDNRSSVINRILKYYCMSSLPFMIDEQRDNGMYFNRKQIKKMFNVIMGLLNQCDITVQLPTLFVENVHDDDYETENTFNDVESFCPGSIKDHISNVERDDEGKNDIIVGVSRIGYTLPNGKSIKTVVIV